MAFNFTESKDILRTATLTEQPELIATHSEKTLQNHLEGRLGDDVWNFYEQAFIAALDVNNTELANTCYQHLQRRFPSSLRVKRLEGLRFEADGNFEAASKIYRSILEEDETNILVAKRQICIYKALGQTTEAITALVKFLDVVYNDVEAWLELSELYLKEHMYQQAAFCMEELILMQPSQHLYYIKLAEILYTIDNVPLALKAYCKVVELCADHVRGFYGLKLCTRRLIVNPIQSAPSKEVLQQLDVLATERLLQIYSSSKSTHPSSQSSKLLLTTIRHWLGHSGD